MKKLSTFSIIAIAMLLLASCTESKMKQFAEEFATAVNKLLEKNVKGLIIDLRGNPGGELITVCQMMDYLIKDRDGRYTLNQKEQIFETGKTLLVYIKEKNEIVDAACKI